MRKWVVNISFIVLFLLLILSAMGTFGGLVAWIWTEEVIWQKICLTSAVVLFLSGMIVIDTL